MATTESVFHVRSICGLLMIWVGHGSLFFRLPLQQISTRGPCQFCTPWGQVTDMGLSKFVIGKAWGSVACQRKSFVEQEASKVKASRHLQGTCCFVKAMNKCTCVRALFVCVCKAFSTAIVPYMSSNKMRRLRQRCLRRPTRCAGHMTTWLRR